LSYNDAEAAVIQSPYHRITLAR